MRSIWLMGAAINPNCHASSLAQTPFLSCKQASPPSLLAQFLLLLLRQAFSVSLACLISSFASQASIFYLSCLPRYLLLLLRQAFSVSLACLTTRFPPYEGFIVFWGDFCGRIMSDFPPMEASLSSGGTFAENPALFTSYASSIVFLKVIPQ